MTRLLSALTTLSLAVGALALPFEPATQQTLSQRALNTSLPNVQIFATGGTISGGSPDPTDLVTYKSGQYTIAQMIDTIPAIKNVSNVAGFQYANVDSGAINTTFALKLAKNIQSSLNSNDSLAGIVVTHGTDTLEETAFLLELTVDSDKPVVMAAAMRPKSSISSDGEWNLLQAISLAGSKQSKKRGTMIVLNDRIGSAYYTTKTNPRALDTFKAPEAGYLGVFEGTEPYYWYNAARPGYLAKNPKFNLTGLDSLPTVHILYAYQEMDVALLNAVVDTGAKGIVIAGIGNGNYAPSWSDRIAEIVKQGIPVVVSTRTGAGTVAAVDPVVAAGSLNPQKAKILLQLVLSQAGDDKVKAVKAAFEHA